MADVFTRKKRSDVMSKIRGRGNLSTEMLMIALMREHGIKGWRRHRNLPGRPDFVFLKEKVAVFVDGCFWHGCPAHYVAPRTAAGFWRAKISGNRDRDRKNSRTLRKLGWRVLRFWEHDFGRGGRSAAVVKKLRAQLAARCSAPFFGISFDGRLSKGKVCKTLKGNE
jgi:DNA mismatch endonuclease (patch repair protein)